MPRARDIAFLFFSKMSLYFYAISRDRVIFFTGFHAVAWKYHAISRDRVKNRAISWKHRAISRDCVILSRNRVIFHAIAWKRSRDRAKSRENTMRFLKKYECDISCSRHRKTLKFELWAFLARKNHILGFQSISRIVKINTDSAHAYV